MLEIPLRLDLATNVVVKGQQPLVPGAGSVDRDDGRNPVKSTCCVKATWPIHFRPWSTFGRYKQPAGCGADRLFERFYFIDCPRTAFLVCHVRYFSRCFHHALSRSHGGRLRSSPSTCASNFPPERISRLDRFRLDGRVRLVADHFARRFLRSQEPAAARGVYERTVGRKACGPSHRDRPGTFS
jgi:hypothetical protein